MYLELLMTSTAVQRDLTNAYNASDRMREIALFTLVLNHATIKFFEQLTPPENCQTLHGAFLKWQGLGIEMLMSEIDSPDIVNPDLTRNYQDATQAFADEMNSIASVAETDSPKE